jgi:hypothetical protein
VAQPPWVSKPLAIIIRAAADGRLLRLMYTKRHEAPEERLVEAYALRRTAAGDLMLVAVDLTRGAAVRNFRVDRIVSAAVAPGNSAGRYRFEMLERPAQLPPATRPRTTPTRPRRGSGHCAVVCPFCGAVFTDTAYNTAIGPHDAPGGGPCEGRHGFPI